MSRHYRVSGRELETDGHYKDGRLTFTDEDGHSHDLAAVPIVDGVWSLRDPDGGTRSVRVARSGDTWWIHYRGRTWTLERITKVRPAAAAGSLTAPMHGTIDKVYVEVGDHVTAGTPLLSISAMKMHIDVRAPHDGTVASIFHAEDEQIEGGALLAVVESEAGSR